MLHSERLFLCDTNGMAFTSQAMTKKNANKRHEKFHSSSVLRELQQQKQREHQEQRVSVNKYWAG